MRHLFELALIEVALLPARVIRAPCIRLLVPPARGAHRIAPARPGTIVTAVAPAAVAVDAQEEHLAAPAAHDEA